jgi:hypothetical protein
MSDRVQWLSAKATAANRAIVLQWEAFAKKL